MSSDFLLRGCEAYRHNGDYDLMESLGLKTRFNRAWTDCGTVEVYPAEPAGPGGPYCEPEPEKPATTIKVECVAMPAQAWRFTITRPRDVVEDTPDGEYRFRVIYEPVEQFVINTGTGGFTEFYQVALMVAKHMLNVESIS